VLPRVDIAATYTGADGTAVQAFRQAGTSGLIVIGFAFNGSPHELQAAALVDAARGGVPVVLVSRGGAGRVPRGDAPFISGDNLSPQKARVLLTVALTRTRDREELQRIFDEY
jgi:L-asparaginase